MSWRVRTAVSADLDALSAIEVDAGARFRTVGLDPIADAEPPPITKLARHLDHGRVWVAEDRGGLVGYAMATTVDGQGHLEEVSVIERVGGQGIGRALVARAERWARENGYRSITLTTFIEVPWNGPWYRRLGYQNLNDNELGPELAGIRKAERDAGLDLAARTAMHRQLH